MHCNYSRRQDNNCPVLISVFFLMYLFPIKIKILLKKKNAILTFYWCPTVQYWNYNVLFDLNMLLKVVCL